MATVKHRNTGNFPVKERLKSVVVDLKEISSTIKTLDFYIKKESPVKSVFIKQISWQTFFKH